MATHRIALTGGRVVPVSCEPLPGGTVLIADGRGEAVGDSALPVPADAAVIDIGGTWVLPGFVDAHTHIGTLEDGEEWAGDDHDEATEPVTARRLRLRLRLRALSS